MFILTMQAAMRNPSNVERIEMALENIGVHQQYEKNRLTDAIYELSQTFGMGIDEILDTLQSLHRQAHLNEIKERLEYELMMLKKEEYCEHELLDEPKEPYNEYHEKLHPCKKGCRLKQYWKRIRSNPRMRVNRSIKQLKRDRQ